MSGQIHDPYAVPAGKDSPLPTEYKNLGRPQKQTVRFGKRIFLYPSWNRTMIPQLSHPLASPCAEACLLHQSKCRWTKELDPVLLRLYLVAPLYILSRNVTL